MLVVSLAADAKYLTQIARLPCTRFFLYSLLYDLAPKLFFYLYVVCLLCQIYHALPRTTYQLLELKVCLRLLVGQTLLL